MAKLHILKGQEDFFGWYAWAYCGLITEEEGLFLERAKKGDICKNCIRCRIAYKRKVRA